MLLPKAFVLALLAFSVNGLLVVPPAMLLSEDALEVAGVAGVSICIKFEWRLSQPGTVHTD